MTAPAGDTADRPPTRPPLTTPAGRRWMMAAAILFAEYLLISVRFDALGALDRGGIWGWAAFVGKFAKSAAIVAAAAVMLLPGTRSSMVKPPPVSAVLLVVHGAFFVAFWRMTQIVFDTPEPPAGSATLWVAGWGCMGLGTALSLALALVGARGLAAIANLRLAVVVTALGAVALFAGESTQHLWARSSGATLRLVCALLGVVFSNVQSDPDKLVVGLGDFWVYVAPQCSGLEGVGLVTVLMVGYLATFRKTLRFPAAYLLVPFAIAAVWLLNGVRLAALIVIGAKVNASLAADAFHARAGWVLFCIVALGISALGRRSRLFSREVPGVEQAENPAAPYLVPVLGLIATALVTSMFADPVDRLYGFRIVVAGVALYAYRRHYTGIRADFSWAPVLAGVVVGAAWVALGTKHPDAGTARDSFQKTLPGSFASWTAFRTLGSVIVVPICEELGFRGYLLRRLVNRDFTSVSTKAWTPVALVVSSLAFGLVHDRWIAATAAGLCYAWVALRSGNLGSAIVAHGITNGMIAAWVIARGDLSLWL